MDVKFTAAQQVWGVMLANGKHIKSGTFWVTGLLLMKRD